jgi:hypothetical protein
MSKANDYNKGVESGLRVAQKLIEKEAEAMDYLKSRVDLIIDGHDEMKMAVDCLIEDADENAIAKIFGICNSVKPNELKDHEKKMLINVLATLGMVKINDDQKRFFNNLRHHLNIEGYEPDTNYDFGAIKSLESVKAIKTIAKALRIYLYLKESSMDGIFQYEDELFSYFEIKSFDEIDAVIETVYCLFGKEGLIEFYGDYGDYADNTIDIKDEEGIIIDIKTLKLLRECENNSCNVSKEIAQKFFSLHNKHHGSNTYNTTDHVIYEKDNRIYCFSKSTGESRLFNIYNLIIDTYSLSEATSDEVMNDYMLGVFNSIKAYGDGFFFSIGPRVYYYAIDENLINSHLVIDLSNTWENEDSVIIKGVESVYFIFSFKKCEWCLLNINTGEIVKPNLSLTEKFVVVGDCIYYAKSSTRSYRKNKSIHQYGEKTDSVQIFQYNLITGKDNPASKKIYPSSVQRDGLGVLESFERVGDNYIMLRKTHFDDSSSVSFVGLMLATIRGYYLYMVFDSHFNSISGDYLKSIDDKCVYSAEYCDDGIVVYEDMDHKILKMISLLGEKKEIIGNGSLGNIINCGNYYFVGYYDKYVINTKEFLSASV